MVKADVRRDYYADLGLTPSADGEEIKKQFRKLALKYHPDRNPGRELEFNAKFQAIQAAHEILCDPQHRLEYDTDRLRAGYGKLYGPSKANNSARRPPTASYPPSPAATTPAAKPPPPKPPFPNRPSSFQNGPATGAQRYASYARAAPQQPWQKTHDSAQTRADAFRGFQGMKNNGAKTPGWSAFDPQTGRSSYQPNSARPSPSATGTPGQFGRPKSAYEHTKTAGKPTTPPEPTRSQSTRKKQGFAPGTAAGGDEPMARSTSSYASVPRAERSQPTAQFYVPVPSPTANKTAPDATFAAHPERPTMPEFERTSSRYAQASGEKTFFSSAWLGRSTSVRDSPGGSRSHSRTNPPSPSSPPSGRHRSASPADRHHRSFSTSTSSSELDDDEDELVFKPKAVPKSRLRSHQKYTNLHTQHEWTSAPGEHPHTTHSDADCPPPPLPRRPGPFGARRPRPQSSYAAVPSPNNTDSDYFQGHDSDSAAFPQGPRPFAAATDSETDDNCTPADQPGASHPASNPTDPSKSASEEHLRKKFSVEDWHDAFQFFGGSPSFASNNAQRGKSPVSNARGRSAARPNSSWASKSATSSSDDAPQAATQQQQQQHPPPSFPDAKFSVDSWVEQLRHVSFDVRPADGLQQQPPRNPPSSSRNAKKPTRPAVKVRSVPQPASVATEAEEINATVEEPGEATNLGGEPSDGEAMDIDDDQPSMRPNGGAQFPGRPAAPPGRDGANAPAANGTTVDPTEQVLNMNKLSNVTPFTSTNDAGIDNLQDISSTLPFDSRPRAPPTHSRPVRARDLHCPNPPKRPRAPEPVLASAGSQQRVLPRPTWQRYVAEMNTYMREWKDFNRRMLAHFNARQDAIETGLAPNWVEAVGDSPTLKIPTDGGVGQDDSGLTDGLGDGGSSSTGELDNDNDNNNDNSNNNTEDILISGSAKGGYAAYLRGLEEDVKVREHWNVACELHRDCILELGRLRDWIRKGGRVV